MEIIEKEKIVEHQDGYYGPNKRDINGKANAGLTLGIIGTALGGELFKAWFGDSVDSKIIESAINFWFKDDDFKSGCKIWKYFNMM